MNKIKTKFPKERIISIRIKEETHRRLKSASFFLMRDMQDIVDEVLNNHLDTIDYVSMAQVLQKKEEESLKNE